MVNPCRTHFYCREAALREGLAVLEAGALSHNHLDFYGAAMEAMLGAGLSEGAAIGLALPSSPGEFHPEPLTEPDVILSHHPGQPGGTGKIVAFPQVGGLHHRYERLAA